VDANLLIAGRALKYASAISCPERFPDTRTKLLAPAFSKAVLSIVRYRILESFVNMIHPRLPTSD